MTAPASDVIETFDFIVVGGGSAGCAVAGRLSEDASVSVCLLEAGGKGDGPLVRTPVGALAMLPTKLGNWGFETVPQPGLGGRRGYQPRGRMLGGSSGINAMIYIRGHRQDYDHWAALGNVGWSFADVLPYFKRSERNERFDGDLHGREGPLWVSDPRTDNRFHARFVEAARGAGLPLNDDFNGVEQEGLGIYQVTQRDGERWSAARAYLLPHLGRIQVAAGDVEGAGAEEACGDAAVEVVRGKQIACHLLLEEAIVGLVRVERIHHPITIAPRLRPVEVMLISVRLRKPNHVEPVLRPSLAECL